MKILLVEPAFPKASKSKNHNDFLPLGLLKLASYHRKKGDIICLVRGDVSKEDLIFENPNGSKAKCPEPDKILITSYFTYWSLYVKRSVNFYRKQFPKKKIIVGGIYASLMPEHCKKYTGCDEVFVGIHPEAEAVPISYKYLEKHFGPIDYQIIHTSRGCIRRCGFCGVYTIEPEFQFKATIKKEIIKRKIIFYDNNLLANPHIEDILTELAYLKEKQKILWCEAQSGIDGRLLEKNPDLAYLLKKAGFRNIRISWDGPYSERHSIKKRLNLLKKTGFNLRRGVFIFMIYNWDIPFEEMEKKRLKCWEWKVQISDCRFRPLTQTFDRYNGQMFRSGQDGRSYYIHVKAAWTDEKIRTFRKHIRRQNICVRTGISFYSNSIERSFLNKYVRNILIDIAKYYPREEAESILNLLKVPYWFPENYNGNGHYVSVGDIFYEFRKVSNLRAGKNNVRTPTFKAWRNKIQREVLTNLKIIK
jgi:hypothetical protein